MKLLFKYKSLDKQKKATIWYMFCNILQKGISFIVVPLYTRFLTVSEYGAYSVFMSWREILIIFATLNLYCGVFTKAMVEHEGDRDVYTSSIQTLGFLITIIISVIYFSVHNFWNSFLNFNTLAMGFMLLSFAFYPAFLYWSVRQRVEYKYVKMIILTLIVSVAIPVTSILLLIFSDLREQAIIIGTFSVQIAIGLVFFIINIVRGKCFFHKKYWLNALKFNIPLIPHYLSLIVLAQSDRIMIGNFCGEAEAGIYSLSSQIASVITVITSAIDSAFVPWTYEKLKSNERFEIGKMYNKLTIFVAALIFLSILVSPEAIMILGTEEYYDSIWIIPILSLGVFLTFIYGLFSNVEFYYGATKYVMMASTIGALLNIGLNAIFIPKYGYYAAAYTTLICYLLFTVLHYLFMRRVCLKNGTKNDVYKVKYLVLISVILTAATCLCMLVYKFWYIRYFLLAVGLILMLIFRKKIIYMFKRNSGEKAMLKKINKDITFIYMDSAEKSIYLPLAEEAKKRGYKITFTTDKFAKCEIGFYCQHINFPKNSKFSVIMLHDIIQQYGNWPNIWLREPWNKYDIGILPSKRWVNNWVQCSEKKYANPSRGVYEIGWPKADKYADLMNANNKEEYYRNNNLDLTKRTILYAPAWENDNKQDDFVQAMLKLDVNILIKQANWVEELYPTQVENIRQMYELHKDNPRVKILDPKTNIFEAIAVSDILVSEESSTMCEAVMMGIPAVSVSDWLIPDVTPSRYPMCTYDFVEITKKADLTECISEMINNYAFYKDKAVQYSKDNFSNIGKSSDMIMDIIDDVVNNENIRYEEVKGNKIKRIGIKEWCFYKRAAIKRAIINDYAVNNKFVHYLYKCYRRLKHGKKAD